MHRPLKAAAVAFGALEEEGPPSESEQILILLDHVLLWPAEMDLLLERASRLSGVGRDSLLVVFSHTHAAGLMGSERESLPGGRVDPRLFEEGCGLCGRPDLRGQIRVADGHHHL